MICSKTYAARWVGAVGFGIAVLLTVVTLNEFTAFMWLFDFDFCMKNRCYVKYITVNLGGFEINKEYR
jgi:hypothetical protein